jgi:hypothetical protein
MLMATTIIFSLTFSSCVKAIKNSIDDEERQNENLAAEQKKSEITRVSDESLIIYTPSQAIKLNPKFKIAGDQEKIKEAYNKPGTQILFSETDSINYLAKSLWTKYNYSKERVMISYDKSKKQFIFWTNKTEIKEALDILPMLIFFDMISLFFFMIFYNFVFICFLRFFGNAKHINL